MITKKPAYDYRIHKNCHDKLDLMAFFAELANHDIDSEVIAPLTFRVWDEIPMTMMENFDLELVKFHA